MFHIKVDQLWYIIQNHELARIITKLQRFIDYQSTYLMFSSVFIMAVNMHLPITIFFALKDHVQAKILNTNYLYNVWRFAKIRVNTERLILFIALSVPDASNRRGALVKEVLLLVAFRFDLLLHVLQDGHDLVAAH